MRFQESQVCLSANSIQSVNPSLCLQIPSMLFLIFLCLFLALLLSLVPLLFLLFGPVAPESQPIVDMKVRHFAPKLSWHNIVLFSLRANQIPIFRWCVPVTTSPFLTESTRRGSPRAMQKTSTEAFPSFITSQPMSPTAWASDSAALTIRLVFGKRRED